MPSNNCYVSQILFIGSLLSLEWLCYVGALLIRFSWGFVKYDEALSSIFRSLLPNSSPHPTYAPRPPRDPSHREGTEGAGGSGLSPKCK